MIRHCRVHNDITSGGLLTIHKCANTFDARVWTTVFVSFRTQLVLSEITYMKPDYGTEVVSE